MTAPPEVIAAAREYFNQGYQVVAVKANKAPWGKNWRRAHNLDEVLKLLEEADCPAIGFLGGELNHGIVPIDFDTPEGDKWFCAQCEAVGIDPFEFPMVVTPGKVGADGKRRQGFHRYVTDVRGTLGNATGPLLAELGIDIRGRGHAMLPPSPHPDGGTYQWMLAHSLLTDFPNGVPPCPLFLYEAIEARYGPEGAAEPVQGNGADPLAEPQFRAPPPFAEAPGGGARASGDYQTRAEAYCRQALANSKARLMAAPDGHRNHELNAQALGLGHLAHFKVFGEGEALSALMAACKANGLLDDPVNGGTVACHRSFYSGWNDGIKDPWPLPPDDNPPRPGFGTSQAWKDYSGEKQDYSADSANYTQEDSESQKDTAANGDGANAEDASQAKAEKPPLWRSFVKLDTDLRTMPAKELEYFVAEFLPKVWLSVINGDGGAGKTTLLMQLFEALGAGAPFLGFATSPCRPLLLMSEEDENLTALKMRKMPEGGPSLFMPLQDWPGPTELVAATRDGQIQAQPFLATLREMIGDLKPDAVALDHVGDFFLINENSKQEVNAALLFLRPLAAEFHAHFFLSQHISKAGMISGRFDAGTTQWHNKSRWRSALYPPGIDENTDENEEVAALAAATRCLQIVKDNYGGRRGKLLTLRWEAGSFILDDGALGKAKASALDDRLLAFALRIIPHADNRRVPLAVNAPNGMVARFSDAMDMKRGHGPEIYDSLIRLINAGKLGRKEEGPPSKKRFYVVMPGEGD